MNKVFNSILYQGIVILATMILKVSTQGSCACAPLDQCVSLRKPLRNDFVYKKYIAAHQCDHPNELNVACDILYVDAPNGYESSLNPIGAKILSEVCEKNNIEEYSSLALLRYNGTEKESNCGGTLITDNFVLTTANCVTDFNEQKLTKVHLGAQNYGINRIMVHNFSDVALIKLDRSVHVEGVQPICLPLKEFGLEKNSKFIITNWIKIDKAFRPTMTDHKRKNCESVEEQHEWPITGNYGAVLEAKGSKKKATFGSKRPKTSYVQYGIFSSNSYISLLDVMAWISNHIAA